VGVESLEGLLEFHELALAQFSSQFSPLLFIRN
jgi:hypothetical protein